MKCLTAVLCLFLMVSVVADDRPNVVLLISDDQAWTDYRFMGHPVIQTPCLDRLAAESCTFKRGYVPIALCRPSLATIITGLYPHQHGITGNDPSPSSRLSAKQYAALRAKLISKIDDCPLLPKILGDAGYVSHQSGKWWEGNFSRGGFTDGMTRGFPEKGGRHGDDGLKIGRRGLQPVTDFIDSAVAKKSPFFVWYAPFLPHTPHNPPERLLKKYRTKQRPIQLAKYFAMCEWFDETCGQLLRYLESVGVSDNTIVVYVTDNGWIQRVPETVVPKQWKPSFAPKSKQSPNEGGTRTPIMIRWPRRLKPQFFDVPITSVDLMPTLLAACDQQIPKQLPGENLLPYLTGDEPIQNLSERPIFGESFAHDIADIDNPQASLLYRWVIHDGWKLVLSYDGRLNRYQAVHALPKLSDLGDREPQLFHLLQDPHETKNVAKQRPKVVERLVGMIEKWWIVDQRKTVKMIDSE